MLQPSAHGWRRSRAPQNCTRQFPCSFGCSHGPEFHPSFQQPELMYHTSHFCAFSPLPSSPHLQASLAREPILQCAGQMEVPDTRAADLRSQRTASMCVSSIGPASSPHPLLLPAWGHCFPLPHGPISRAGMGAGGWMRPPTLDGGDPCSTAQGRTGLAGEKLGSSAVRSSVAAKAARLTSAQGNADVQQAGSPAPNRGTLARTRSNFPIEFLSACG